MNNTLSRTIVYLVVIILQLSMDYFFNLGYYVMISLLPFLIINLPCNSSTPKSLLIAFILGVCVDLLGNHIIGITTSSLLFATLFRRTTLKLVLGEDVLDKSDRLLEVNTNALGATTIILVVFNLMFICSYILLENITFLPLLKNLLRIVIFVLVNSSMYMAYHLLYIRRG